MPPTTLPIALCVALMIIIPSCGLAEKILFAYPVAIPSHGNVFLPIVQALAERGHDVTLFTSLKPNRKLPTNVRQIIPETLDNMMGIITNDSYSMLKNPILRMPNTLKVPKTWCERIMGDPTYQKEFWQRPEDKYDLVILSAIGNECLFGLLWRNPTPFVLVSPTGIFPWTAAAMGNPSYAAAAPAVFLISSSNRMDFWERLANFGVLALYRVIIHLVTVPQVTEVLRRELPDYPDWDLTKNASLLLLNTDISVDYPRPLLPNIKEVGGLHCQDAKPLPDELEQFVNKPGSKGLIFFSLGSTVKGIHVPKEFRKVFVDVFRSLEDYQILWKWEEDTVEGMVLPPNVRLGKWLPQQDILGHPRTKLFITQGGLLSTHEATYHGVPMVGLPVGSDQLLNMRRSVVAGVGLMINWEDLTVESLLSAVTQVLNDPTFAANVKTRSEVMKDHESKPLDRAVFWIEYIIRHKGAPHLRSSLPDLNFVQAHGLDVIAFVASILLVFAAISTAVTYYCLRCVLRKCFGKQKNKQGEGNKKNN